MTDTKEIYVTTTGLEEMKSELDNLIQVKRPEVIKALKEARALGDLSENAEYDAARQEQAQTEARIKELESMIEHAVVIENVDTNEVSIGTRVTIEYVGDDDTQDVDVGDIIDNDVDTTVKVFRIMLDMLKEKGAKTVNDIDKVAADENYAKDAYKKLPSYMKNTKV